MATQAQLLECIQNITASMQMLSDYRDQLTDSVDRAAIASQIKTLALRLADIEIERTTLAGKNIDDIAKPLGDATEFLTESVQDLKKTAQAIHAAARVVGLAEKLAAMAL